MYSKALDKKVKEAPLRPGCYIWKTSDGSVLYVGKAVNIRSRASSYLNNYKRLDPKIRAMIDLAKDVNFYEVDSEVEALILETNLIKKYKPKYNRLMKDDKNYVWLKIDWYNKFPKLVIVREKKDKKAEYYGPYPVKFPVTKVLRSLRKIYPYCETPPVTEDKVESKPCFNYHIALCSGVCAGLETRLNHRKNINGIRNFFKGKKDKDIEKLKVRMNKLSQKQDFEKAAEVRDKLRDLEYVTQRIKISQEMDENLLLLAKKDSKIKSQEELIKYLTPYRKLNDQNISDFRIECYDISNTQGTNPTGSMVVFVDGEMQKSEYRKFRVKSKETPDDFGMMREVLSRRLKKISVILRHSKEDILREPQYDKKKSKWAQPSLIIVDGGKGQLSSAYKILCEFSLENKIALVGLAKREEELFFVKNQDSEELEFGKIVLPRKSGSLYLIQRIRDEAHRFAIGYHKKLRSKGQVKSVLDDIPGVGKVTKIKLYEAFGTIKKMKKKSFEEINAIVRNKATAEKIWKVIGI